MPKARDTSDMVWSDYFYYDENSPSFLRWKISPYTDQILRVASGDMAGSLQKRGYYSVGLKRNKYFVHRVIFEMFKRKLDFDEYVDHLDGNRVNNSVENLRAVSYKENTHNNSKRVDNTSGVVGVSFSDRAKCGSWVAAWVDSKGDYKRKTFNIDKCGGDKIAFEMACKYREDRIKEQVVKGAKYTERHGK